MDTRECVYFLVLFFIRNNNNQQYEKMASQKLLLVEHEQRPSQFLWFSYVYLTSVHLTNTNAILTLTITVISRV